MDSKLHSMVRLWTNLTSPQKLILTFFGAAVAVASVLVGTIASRPDYDVLFANLKPQDAAAITQKLSENKVPYRITGNGTAVEVPSTDVHQVRLNMAGEGLPEGGSVGFEIFDKTSLGVTDFAQKMNFQRALQGELQRTIGTLQGVQDVRVHIAMPDETLYSAEEKDASASVLLELNGSGSLNEEQVGSIVNLVSAAVEGLKPERVNVADTRGNLLHDGSGVDSGGIKMSSSQLGIKRNVERGIQHDVETMLDKVVGPGKAVVRVNARLSFDSRETTSELFEPSGEAGSGIITSQETTRETYGSGARNAGGVPGTASNTATGAAQPPANATRDGYEREQENTKYQVSKKLERVAQAPGGVEQLSVAVLVDKEVGADKIASIEQAVAAAAGIDPARGDRAVVQTVAFPKAAAPAKPTLAASAGKYLEVGRNVAALVILAVFALFLRGALSRQSINIQTQTTHPVQDIIHAQEPTPQPIVLEKRLPPEMDIPLESAQQIAREKPEEIVEVVRTWMSDNKRAA